jgi:MoxR-like ATPase
LLRITLGYPDREDELQILANHRHGEPVDRLEPVLDCEQIVGLQERVREVRVSDAVHEYLLDVVHATRTCGELHVGVSTRGALSLYRASQALALVEGRDFVTPDDVKRLCVPVMAHRVIPRGYAHGSRRATVEALVQRLVDETPVRE